MSMLPRNPRALIAYYCGFGSLISALCSPCLFVAIDVFGPPIATANSRLIMRLILVLWFAVISFVAILAMVFGVLGVKYASNHPEAKGSLHAITGLILGGLVVLIIVGLIGMTSKW